MTQEVTVIGCDGSPLAPQAAAALALASRVAGAHRQLDAVDLPPAVPQIEITRLEPALDEICHGPGPVAVLASGDPGFFGIVRALRARGVAPKVIPAVSSVALAFARLGLNWDDALVLSAHGRDALPVLAAALAHPKVVILTGPGAGAPQRFVGELLAAGRKVYAAECLGTADERVTEQTGAPGWELAEIKTPNVLVAVDPAAGGGAAGGGAAGHAASGADGSGEPGWLAGHAGAPPGWALHEGAFEHRDSMITKAEVRAVVLARIGPGPGRIVWDIGAGSGSVAVECARFGAFAVAVESDPAQFARIRRNATAHGVYVRVARGRAPGALADLPAPDAVFAGGGDDEVIAAAIRLGNPARVVVTLASLDRVRSVRDLLAGSGYRADGVQLQASRLAGLPGGSVRLAAANPVFVIWGERTG